MALISTLTDNFDDNSKGAQWGTNGNPFGAATTGVTVSETSGQLQVTPASSESTEFTSGYIAADFYELTASNAFVRLVQSTSTSTPAYTYFRISDGGGSGVGFDVESGRLLMREGANTLSDIAYSATTHAWLRVRESGGTVFWDTATSSASNPPASGDWTNRASTSSFATGTASVKAYIGAGTYSSVASPGTAIFDGFNTATTGGGATTPISAAATAKGTAVLVKAPRLVKAAQAKGTPKIVRSVSLSRAATGKGAARVVRLVSKILTTRAVGTAAMTLLRVTTLALVATARGLAAVVKQANLVKAAQARGTARVVRSISLTERATARGVARVVRSIAKRLAATGKGSAALVKSAALTLRAAGKATASVVATFIAGGTTILAAAVGRGLAAMSMLVMKVLPAQAKATGDVVVESTVARIVGRLTGQAGLGLYLRAGRAWQKRRRTWKPRGQ